MHYFSRSATLLAFVLIGSTGCQKKIDNVSVEGTVTKGGVPQPGIEVVFLADPDSLTIGPRAFGITDESGRYYLRTDKGELGTVPGTHRVLVQDKEYVKYQLMHQVQQPTRIAARKAMAENPNDARDESQNSAEIRRRVPPRYERINETPLRATVGPGPAVFDIAIP